MAQRVSETGLSVTDIATRMCYLGYLTGTAIAEDGTPVLDIDSVCTRISGLIFALRFMGVEQDALTENNTCSFKDVPDWAAPYVGYAEAHSLLYGDDFAGGEFGCAKPMDTSWFLSLIIKTLGYDLGEQWRISGAVAAQLGIVDSIEPAMSRGDAIVAMWSALRAYCANDSQTFAEKLIAGGRLEYNDAVFLVWSVDAAETEQYLKTAGLSVMPTLADGYYTISLESTGKCLNVYSDGPNGDYDGVPVTVWRQTSDVTQRFRIERTERGTYKLYAASSKGGFNRLLGDNVKSNGLALWRQNANLAGEYYIKRVSACPQTGSGDNNKCWYIIPAGEEIESVLTVTDPSKDGCAITAAPSDVSLASGQHWIFTSDGVTSNSGQEMALFPNDVVNITQGAYENYSHGRQNAIDCVSNTRFFAPFTGVIKHIGGTNECNGVYLESVNPVMYADGTCDYMTVLFMHDDDTSDLYEGQVIPQGQAFIDKGSAGDATGAHVHIAVYRGKYDANAVFTGSGNVYAQNAFFLLRDTVIKSGYDLSWSIIY